MNLIKCRQISIVKFLNWLSLQLHKRKAIWSGKRFENSWFHLWVAHSSNFTGNFRAQNDRRNNNTSNDWKIVSPPSPQNLFALKCHRGKTVKAIRSIAFDTRVFAQRYNYVLRQKSSGYTRSTFNRKRVKGSFRFSSFFLIIRNSPFFPILKPFSVLETRKWRRQTKKKKGTAERKQREGERRKEIVILLKVRGEIFELENMQAGPVSRVCYKYTFYSYDMLVCVSVSVPCTRLCATL